MLTFVFGIGVLRGTNRRKEGNPMAAVVFGRYAWTFSSVPAADSIINRENYSVVVLDRLMIISTMCGSGIPGFSKR